MKSTTCKNCGGDQAIHHYETMQCPAGGHEAAIGRKQEWISTKFEVENNEVEEELRELIKRVVARLEALESTKP